ncbi:uncharacterized protein LOC111831523 [Capsella rubella]|uniref:uncharacterized protein LOC111831523 n=1 Tax=Capsella rubella TaxID=81985 RepID=UPI000CD531A0|nr:uncharacterized protein LOC111831523 [Capsella rubella]
MEYALDKALQEMTLEEERPIILKNLPQFSSCERNVCSSIGRLLCPENQKMSKVIHDMPRLWRVYNRVRGIALPNDRFQFIFDSETDLSMVLNSGAWTYNDWSMTLERWVEKPPSNYLKVLPIWLRLCNIPVNHNTAATVREIAEYIGQVTDVAFGPLKPQSKRYVRVRVLFDVNRPLRNTWALQIPSGETVTIGIEYERIRRRCYQCQRLTHDKDRCPFNPSNRQAIATGGVKPAAIIPSRLIPKISKDDPLFGVLTDDDVGIDVVSGKPKIAKEVLDEMRQYLSVSDPQMKKVNIERVRKSVWDLEGDSKGQKTLLRLEAPTKFTTDVDKDKGLVFDFSGVNEATSNNEGSVTSAVRKGTAMTRLSEPVQSSSATYVSAAQSEFGSTDIRASFSAGSTGTKVKNGKRRRRPHQWVRKAQAVKKVLEPIQTDQDLDAGEGFKSKRKVVDEAIVSSKIAKRDEFKVVPNEEPPSQV